MESCIPEQVNAADNFSMTPLEQLVFSEMNQALQVAIDALPPRCRLIFNLVREDGLAYKEVAEILGISVNTIDCQMAIALKRISASLGLTRKPKTAVVFITN
jgi:RNA polymerase sigma-70 factor (ECF subfamily)